MLKYAPKHFVPSQQRKEAEVEVVKKQTKQSSEGAKSRRRVEPPGPDEHPSSAASTNQLQSSP